MPFACALHFSVEGLITRLSWRSDADAMLNSGKDLAAVLQALEVSESTYDRRFKQYDAMKSEEGKRLKGIEDEANA